MKTSFAISSLFAYFLLTFSFAAALLPVTGWGPSDRPQEPFLDMEAPQRGPPTPQDTGGPIVSDALSVQRDVSIFSEFVRGATSVLQRLEDSNLNTTVLAPLNSAIKALPRKPWEDPDMGNNVEGKFAGLDGEKRAAENLERFVKAHMIPVSPFNENEKVQTLEGVTVWWTTENGITKIYPGGIEVKEVKNSVPNGQVWTLTRVINYAV
ncbi:hypothetical protein ABW20_dc0106990 [Dactylellina cionopaga]|nr:hypothetical protein ABW20_dc0106990 [Dactylellina cionopaga]